MIYLYALETVYGVFFDIFSLPKKKTVEFFFLLTRKEI